ncbi:MAG: cytochrome b/b6 domain-containing protein [Pseudobdellovibrionaceae bacterium]
MTDAPPWKVAHKIFHWGIALCITLDAFLLEDAAHRWIGYAALVFVISRLTFGWFVSTPTRPNFLAKLVYVSIWTLIVFLAVTGWAMGLDEYWGEEWLENLHSQLSNVLLGLIFIHLAGLLLDALYFRRNSWKRMIPFLCYVIIIC